MSVPSRKRWFALTAALSTALGLGRRGVFVPLKYAGSVEADPAPYAPWERAFAAATFDGVLDGIAAERPRIGAAMAGPLAPHLPGAFPPLDIAALFAVMAAARPARVVEVGSGLSTRAMAAARDALGLQTQITCIDPVPRQEIADLGVDWEARILSASDVERFRALGPGDIAFFDSSHVLLQGTDCDIVFNRILPELTSGVLVHLHDVFLPDPYPPGWRLRVYSEQLGLSGWVLGGRAAPVFAAHYVATRRAARLSSVWGALPGPARGGSLWLRMGPVDGAAPTAYVTDERRGDAA